MRNFRKTLVAFVTTAAVLAPAGIAAADPNDGLVNVYAYDIANGNQVTLLQNVSIPVAATLCNVNAAVLANQLATTQTGTCNPTSTTTQNAWVAW